MLEGLKVILKIQDLDIKMLRLMRVKKERQEELQKLFNVKDESQKQAEAKEKEILEIKKETRWGEAQVKEIQEKIAKLEASQAAVKKMDEFNALTAEMTQASRDKNNIETKLSDLLDKLAQEEEQLESLKTKFKQSEEESSHLGKEIEESIGKINEEGQELLKERESLIKDSSQETFRIYERLLKNKRDRVLVPIENRTCTGCHIVLTPQHENQVRKGDRIVFCEHCSRMLYWQESEPVESGEAPKRRRRKTTAA